MCRCLECDWPIYTKRKVIATCPKCKQQIECDGIVGQVMIHAVPREQWPAWAKLVASEAEEPDTGVGDTIARKLGIAGELFKSWAKTLGIPCGCATRQKRFNAMYPY
jgi:hypothetical protein